MSKKAPPTKPKQHKRRHVQTEARLAQQAKFLRPNCYQRGNSGNGGGRPRQHAEFVTRIRENVDEMLDRYFELMRKEHLTSSDKIRFLVLADAFDRGFGRAPHTLAAAIQHTSLDGTALHLEGAAMSPLLAQAHAYAANEAKRVRSPIAGSSRIIAAPVASVEPAAPLIVDPVGNGAVCVETGSAAHTGAAEPTTATERPPEPAQEAAGATPPFGAAPAEGVAYMASQQRERDQELARKVEEARAQGRPQISATEAFPADRREPAEVVRLTRAAGGRIKRC